MRNDKRSSAALYAAGAAALFGLSVPLSKTLLADVGPVMLAGLLYAGAGSLLALVRLLRRRPESGIRVRLARVLVIAVLGGALGPIALVEGLARTSATAASLLLNLEAPLTVVLAALVLHEPFSRRSLLAILLVLGAAVGVSFTHGSMSGSLFGALLVAFACLAWAADNIISRSLADADPRTVVALKGLIAAPLALAAAHLLGEPFPPLRILLSAMLVGGACYGVSLALWLRAARELGAARTTVLFAAGPFLGAAFSWPLLGERPSAWVVAAGLLMAVGMWLLVTERHRHRHVHEPIEHDHLHVHDEHHQHPHPGDVGPEPHRHLHRHEPLDHEHPHDLDEHHRHRH